MDDTIDIEKNQHARFILGDGRVVIYYDTASQSLVVSASAGLRLHTQQDSETTLSISAVPSS